IALHEKKRISCQVLPVPAKRDARRSVELAPFCRPGRNTDATVQAHCRSAVNWNRLGTSADGKRTGAAHARPKLGAMCPNLLNVSSDRACAVELATLSLQQDCPERPGLSARPDAFGRVLAKDWCRYFQNLCRPIQNCNRW